MDYASMIELPSGAFGRKDIETAASRIDGFKPTQLRNLIADLLGRGDIVRVGRGTYMRSNGQSKLPYQPRCSAEVELVSRVLERDFPLLECRVWCLSDLNEFLNHQMASSVVFAQIEHEGMEFAFESLRDSLKDEATVLLRPSTDDVARYGGDVTVTVTRLVSEAPAASDGKRSVAIEQMAVDMYADRLIASMLPEADYPAALEEMFARYTVNESTLFRYARRRGKEEELAAMLRGITSVRLHGKVQND